MSKANPQPSTKRRSKANLGANNGHSEAVEIIDIGDLNPDNKNARVHTPRGVGMIVNALHEVGAARSGVIDERRKVLAGNATLDALAQAGIHRVKVVSANGDEWVVVKRSGLTEKQKTRLALYDNRTSELSEWDAAILGSDKDLLDGLFSQNEMDKLFTIGDENEFIGEVEFGAELMERQDYLILRFTNELDWRNAVQIFDVKPVKVASSKDERVERYGRVLDGAAVLKMILDARDK